MCMHTKFAAVKNHKKIINMNNIGKLFTAMLCTMLAGGIYAQDVQQTQRGASFQSQGLDVNVEFLSPEIVRVVKAPTGKDYTKNSLVVIMKPEDTKLSSRRTATVQQYRQIRSQ